MAVSMIGPKFYAWDRNGKPLAFGKLYTYQARTNTPKPTYQSEDQQVENTNPVILNGEGYANVYLDGSYKMVLKDDKDNEIWSSDPVTAAKAEEWVNCLTATYLSPTSFKVNGNFVSEYEPGRRVRIDNGAAQYSYSTIQSSTFASGETTIVIPDPVVTTGIQEVCASIVGPESIGLISDKRYSPVFSTVEKMKSGEANDGTQVSEFILASSDISAKTQSYYDGWAALAEPQGSASYILTTRQKVRDALGNASWEPDGTGDHYLFGGTDYVAWLLVSNGVVNALTYGVGQADYVNEIYDDIFAASKAKKVYTPKGDYTLQGNSFLNVAEGFEFYGDGKDTNFKSETGGRDGFYVQLAIKDRCHVHDFSLSGSDYLKQQPSSPSYQAYNKVGISSQGAATGNGIKIERIGFEKMVLSHVFIFDNHSDVDITECYTFGTQYGFYAQVDGNNLVTDPNVAPNDTALGNGTQTYNLTNFYNSGQAGTKDIRIWGNSGVNINDSYVAVNGTCSDHKVWGNKSVKNTDGYYGGFGLDINGGSDNKCWGNHIEGHGIGAFVHESTAKDNKIFGNTFRTPTGILYDTGAQSNRDWGNDHIISNYGNNSLQKKFGRGAGVASRGLNTIRNQSSAQVKPVTTSTTLSSGSITNVSAHTNGATKITTSAAHGLGGRAIVEIESVTGVDANGLWEIGLISDTEFFLIASTFSGTYGGGGSWASAVVGFAALRDQGKNQTSLITDDPRVEDINTGFWVTDDASNSNIQDLGATFSNVPRPYVNDGVYGNNISNATGISSKGTRCKNLTGIATIVNGTTETQVTFTNQEDDALYGVLLSNSIADVSLRYSDKTSSGFKILHDNSGFDREATWMIIR